MPGNDSPLRDLHCSYVRTKDKSNQPNCFPTVRGIICCNNYRCPDNYSAREGIPGSSFVDLESDTATGICMRPFPGEWPNRSEIVYVSDEEKNRIYYPKAKPSSLETKTQIAAQNDVAAVA